ncbi:MAG: PIN domain-containing protein [Gammaproteobacteria bacterium]|nr:PIN domain-containing protein [Gammaproteobacteria bacterium]MYA66821.1 PIN domain-containing protein [Gammaproteobacteria bacterium]MYF01244.1 PIN domain-containing protein [Gammaproteobacteria bacterium]MYG97184.1 PIN domain-containing protein [Gammaproteobacteria bacterium]MYH46762.1 PIN domain-containing protein [Gammaproteobacteria bacterium]
MILLDTDVLIDLALDRQPHAPAAARLIDSIEQGDQRACIAWHTISNFYYIVAPSRGRENVKKFIVELTRFVDVASADAHAVRFAASLAMADFEDALQVAAARAVGARRIVTRNTKDYARSPIPAVLPETAIENTA